METEKLPMAAALKDPLHATGRPVRNVGNVQSEVTEQSFT